MSQNLSNNPAPEKQTRLGIKRFPRTEKAILFCLLVVFGFGAAQFIIVALIKLLQLFGVSFAGINASVLVSAISVAVYVITLAIVIGLPWLVRKYRTTREDVGLVRLLSWSDIGFAPAGFVIYMIATALVSYGVSRIFPEIDLNQAQDTGFKNIGHQYEYMLAFLTLVVLAPVAEEVLFRGYLYGKLRKLLPVWVAMLITSALFGAAHGQWNVGIDVFVLSLVLCSLREVTGSIWAGILLHMIKNGLAFYILFINPMFLHTMGG